MKAALVLLAVTIADMPAQVQLLPLVPGPQQQTGNFSAIAGSAQQQTGNATLEGTVVDAQTHEPIKKASVMLNGRVGLTAVTDASGHFAFRQLPAGQYMVQAQSERYPRGQLGLEMTGLASITIAGDEQKRDVILSLTPGASIRGRILDEEGSPLPQCNVSVMRKMTTDNGSELVNAGGGALSDENGEYQIVNLPGGKYYVMANCARGIPLPHALIPRGPADNLPMLVYRNLFYPGGAYPTGAARVEAQPGGLVAGIDFHMVPASGVTVRGRVQSFSPDRNLLILLQPTDPLRQRFEQQGAGTNPSTNEFRIVNVLPGSYELVAMTPGASNPSYFAKVPVEVGASAPNPIELLLTPGVHISGTLVIEGDDQQPVNSNPVHLGLSPTGNPAMFGLQPQAEVKNDGTFVFDSVIPGRWRVGVNGPGYVKSVALGDQQTLGNEVEITAAAGPLKIVMGTKYVQVAVSVAPPPASPVSLSGVAWGASFQDQQGLVFDPQGTARLSVPPGQYHICACSTAQQPLLFQNRALRRALESQCETVDIVEGGQPRVQISAIPSEELKRIADSLDE